MRRLLLMTLGSLSLVACAATPAAPTVDVTGRWNGVVLSPGAGYIDDGLQFTLNQQGPAVTGELLFPSAYANGVPVAFEHFGTLQGQVSGNSLSLVSQGEGVYAGERVEMRATVGQRNLTGTLLLSKTSGSFSYPLSAQRADTP